MFIKHVPSSRLGEVVAGLVREGVVFNATPENDAATHYTIELTGDSSKLDAFVNALREFRIIEVVRSGGMGIARGETALRA